MTRLSNAARIVHPGCSGPGSHSPRNPLALIAQWRMRIALTYGEAVASKIERAAYPEGAE